VAEPKPPKRRKPDEEREIDYLICRQCSTPSYIFDLEGANITEATCLVCGNDNTKMFGIGEEAGSEEDG
jgi:hypothetical protein